MSAPRYFSLESGFDFSITLRIDTAILTPQFAAEIARFWSSKDEVLEASEGDDYQAVARYAAAWLWGYLMDGYTRNAAVAELHRQEGWCIPGKRLGITVIDYEIADFAAASLDAREIPIFHGTEGGSE